MKVTSRKLGELKLNAAGLKLRAARRDWLRVMKYSRTSDVAYVDSLRIPF